MTVSTSYAARQFTGSGSVKTFPISDPFFAPSDLVLTLFDTSSNAVVTPAPVLNGTATYDYTVTGTKDADTGEYLSGGTITLNNNLPAGYRLTVERQVASTQGLALTNNAAFPAKSLEAALDRMTMIIQQQTALLNRAFQLPTSDPTGTVVTLPAAATRANQILGFDGSGVPIALASIPASQSVSAVMLAVVQAATLALARAAMAVPGLADANVFSVNQTIQSADPGATVGPVLTLDRNSASPAAADIMGAVQFSGRNGSAATIVYGGIQLSLTDPVAATEDGAMQFQTMIAGSIATRMTLAAGLRIGSPSGGDTGAGTINVSSGFYLNGTQLFAVGNFVGSVYDSGVQALPSLGSAVSLTHGLGAAPKFAEIILQNVTAEAGYSTGDQVVCPREVDAVGRGLFWAVDNANTTQIRIINAANAISVPNKTTGAVVAITQANWNYIVRAYR